jgi:putative oxidoreductase
MDPEGVGRTPFRPAGESGWDGWQTGLTNLGRGGITDTGQDTDRPAAHPPGQEEEMPTGRFLLRTTLGTLMLGHGLQKLNGSFGGQGLEATEQAMGALGLHPAKHQARAAALSETVGGGLTALGFLSPLGPAMIAGTMVVAIQKVHAKNGVWISDGGFEYNALIIAAALTLAAQGPGPVSLDGLLRKERSGQKWGVLALAMGVAGAATTLAVANRFRPDDGPEAGGGEGSSDPSADPTKPAPVPSVD